MFITQVNRESQQTKVLELMEAVPDFLDEMDANWELKRSTIPITPKFLSDMKDFSSFVGLMINFLYLGFATRIYHYREPFVE